MKDWLVACPNRIFEDVESFLVFYWIASLIAMKCFLIYHFCYKLVSQAFYYAPAFFATETLIILAILGVKWTINKICIPDALKKALRRLLFISAILLTGIVYTAALGSILRVGFVISWYTMICSYLMVEIDIGVVGAEIKPAIVIMIVQAVILILGCVLFRRRHDYEPVENLDSPSPKLNNRLKFLFILLAISGALISLSFTRKLRQDPNVIYNPIWLLPEELNQIILQTCEAPIEKMVVGANHTEWFKQCQTFNELIIQARSPVQVCNKSNPTKYLRDLSFIKRGPDSTIRNVVLVMMESTRAEMIPFDYDSRVGQKLTKAMRDARNMTTFMSGLTKKSLYSNHAKALASYTGKSMIGSFCSMYPMPRNYVCEAGYTAYKTCLAKLLSKYGFSTGFVQPMILQFDNNAILIKKMGYEFVFAAEEMKRITNYPNKPIKYVNNLGYEDAPFLGPMMDWVDNQVNQSRPFFLTYCSSVSHSDFDTPPSWPIRTYTEDNERLNKYFNAQNYMDQFMENFMKGFEKRGLDKNTLFIFIGDHGVSLGEHNSWLAPELPYETQFRIPMLIYSGNDEWNRRFPPRQIMKPWTTIDVIPTILDALRYTNSPNVSLYEDLPYLYEGQSLIRKTYENRVQLSLANPGISYIVVREGGRKAAFPQNTNKQEEYFDLKVDPHEENSVDIKTLSPDLKEWFDGARFIKTMYMNKVAEWYSKSGGNGLLREE